MKFWHISFRTAFCTSTYKAAVEGTDHKRVPNDIAENPIIVGHEFCGEIVQVGAKWADQFKVGDKFSIQPAINYKGSLAAPGYSYQYIGGSATYIVIPNEVMEMNCLLPYDNEAFFYGSLAEPVSCCIGGFHAQHHTTPGVYVHKMDIKEGGYLGMFAAAGPMGLGAIDYAIHGPIKPLSLSLPTFLIEISQGLFRAEEALFCAVCSDKLPRLQV